VAGIAPWQIVLTTFILNLRHLLMSASLAQRIPAGLSRKWRALIAFGITDETFSVASMQEQKTLHRDFILGLNIVAFISWNAGTWVGIFLAAGLPSAVQNSMGIALYAMFIGLLVPSLRTSRSAAGVCFMAVIFHSLLHWGVSRVIPLSAGWNIILATLFSAALGVKLFAGEGDNLE